MLEPVIDVLMKSKKTWRFCKNKKRQVFYLINSKKVGLLNNNFYAKSAEATPATAITIPPHLMTA